MLKSLGMWYLRGWLLWLVLPLVIVLIIWCEYNGTLKFLSGGFAIGSGLCLLIVLLRNIKILTEKSILRLIIEYFYNFPAPKKPVALQVDNCSMQLTSNNLLLFSKNSWKTTKEGVAEMEKRIEQLYQLCTKGDRELQGQIDTHSKQIKYGNRAQENGFQEINIIISDVILKDYKLIILSIIFTIASGISSML